MVYPFDKTKLLGINMFACDCKWTRTNNHLVCKGALNHLAKLDKSLSWVVNTDLYGASDCMFLSCHTFQSQSTLYSCLNVKKLLAQNKSKIWRLSDCNWTPTHNHLVCKWTLNYLAKLAKWLSWVESGYLYSAFDYIFLSYIRILKWTHTL